MDHDHPHPTGMTGMTDHPMDMDHSMKMFFHVCAEATILFEGWKTETAGEMVGSCFAVFFMAIIHEGFKVGREMLLKRSHLKVRSNILEISSSSTKLTQETYNTGELPLGAHQYGSFDREEDDSYQLYQLSMFSGMHILQSFLHIIQVVLSYFLMLIFMTYNVYLCIAVALGAGVGYFLFSWKRAVVVDVNEHCH